MSTADFFDEQTDQSAVKSEIVAKYFWAWATVMKSRVKNHGNKIAYIDLYSGPGIYRDGSKSTPIKVLESTINDASLKNILLTVFNDADPEKVKSLQRAVSQIPDIQTLVNQPIYLNRIVDDDFTDLFDRISMPTFYFLDPWGYKGLSLKLIGSAIHSWGCECIIFFNYNRISISLNNRKVIEHMDALFGKARAEALRKKCEALSVYEKESVIVSAISEALKEAGAQFTLEFPFKDIKGKHTSHYLIFATKNQHGHKIMKDIMARASSTRIQGVPSLDFNPAAKRQRSLSEYSQPIDELAGELLDDFAGQTF